MKFETRDEIEEQYRWDLSGIFQNDEEFLASLKQAQKYPEKYLSFKGTISKEASNLLAFLHFNDEVDS